MKTLRPVKYLFSRGFTLIETVIYIAFLVTIIGLTTALATQLIRVNRLVQTTDDIISSARSSMEVMSQEIRHASSVYTPTSTFGSHPGQLSLETTRDVLADETETYVDFYLDDNRIFMKREGASSVLLTKENTVVDNLVFTYLNQVASVPAIRIEMTVASNTTALNPFLRRTITLVNTVSLRSYD